MLKAKVKKNLAAAAYTLAITFAIGRWASCMAFLERGYEAAGGEYLIMPVVCVAAWKAINYLFDTMEGLKHERKCKEDHARYGKRAPGQRPERPYR